MNSFFNYFQEQSSCKANKVAQRDEKFGLWGLPQIPSKKQYTMTVGRIFCHLYLREV